MRDRISGADVGEIRGIDWDSVCMALSSVCWKCCIWRSCLIWNGSVVLLF